MYDDDDDDSVRCLARVGRCRSGSGTMMMMVYGRQVCCRQALSLSGLLVRLTVVAAPGRPAPGLRYGFSPVQSIINLVQ